MSATAPLPPIRPRKSVSISFLLVLAGFLLFGALTWYTVVQNRVVTLEEQRAEERRGILGETLAKQQDIATTAGWVDETAGIARIPIEDAMSIALGALRNKAVGPSGVLTDEAMAAQAAAQPQPPAPVATPPAVDGAVPRAPNAEPPASTDVPQTNSQ